MKSWLLLVPNPVMCSLPSLPLHSALPVLSARRSLVPCPHLFISLQVVHFFFQNHISHKTTSPARARREDDRVSSLTWTIGLSLSRSFGFKKTDTKKKKKSNFEDRFYRKLIEPDSDDSEEEARYRNRLKIGDWFKYITGPYLLHSLPLHWTPGCASGSSALAGLSCSVKFFSGDPRVQGKLH